MSQHRCSAIDSEYGYSYYYFLGILVAVVADWAPLLCFSASPLTLRVENKEYTDISALRFANT